MSDIPDIPKRPSRSTSGSPDVQFLPEISRHDSDDDGFSDLESIESEDEHRISLNPENSLVGSKSSLDFLKSSSAKSEESIIPSIPRRPTNKDQNEEIPAIPRRPLSKSSSTTPEFESIIPSIPRRPLKNNSGLDPIEKLSSNTSLAEVESAGIPTIPTRPLKKVPSTASPTPQLSQSSVLSEISSEIPSIPVRPRKTSSENPEELTNFEKASQGPTGGELHDEIPQLPQIPNSRSNSLESFSHIPERQKSELKEEISQVSQSPESDGSEEKISQLPRNADLTGSDGSIPEISKKSSTRGYLEEIPQIPQRPRKTGSDEVIPQIPQRPRKSGSDAGPPQIPQRPQKTDSQESITQISQRSQRVDSIENPALSSTTEIEEDSEVPSEPVSTNMNSKSPIDDVAAPEVGELDKSGSEPIGTGESVPEDPQTSQAAETALVGEDSVSLDDLTTTFKTVYDLDSSKETDSTPKVEKELLDAENEQHVKSELVEQEIIPSIPKRPATRSKKPIDVNGPKVDTSIPEVPSIRPLRKSATESSAASLTDDILDIYAADSPVQQKLPDPLSRQSSGGSVKKAPPPPPKPKKPSSKILAFQQQIMAAQQQALENKPAIPLHKPKPPSRSSTTSSIVSENDDVTKGNAPEMRPKKVQNDFAKNLNGLWGGVALPGMVLPGQQLPSVLTRDVQDEEEPVSDVRKSRTKGPRGRKLPKGATEPVVKDETKYTIHIAEAWELKFPSEIAVEKVDNNDADEALIDDFEDAKEDLEGTEEANTETSHKEPVTSIEVGEAAFNKENDDTELKGPVATGSNALLSDLDNLYEGGEQECTDIGEVVAVPVSIHMHDDNTGNFNQEGDEETPFSFEKPVSKSSADVNTLSTADIIAKKLKDDLEMAEVSAQQDVLSDELDGVQFLETNTTLTDNQ